MDQGITFKIGPLVVRIEGDHLVAQWAQDAFSVLKCSETPDLIFRLVDQPVHHLEEKAVGDGRTFVGDQILSYRARHYDVRIKGGNPAVVEVFQRNRRSLFMKSLIDLDETWKMWLSHGASLDMKLLKDFAYSIFLSFLQSALMERRAALIHASGFSVEGNGILLPAWGGVGKSTIMSRTVLHGKAKFLTDDHAVIDADGLMYLHTLPIHVYAYHLKQDKELRDRVLSGLSRINRMQWRIGKAIKPGKAVRWVNPQLIFGESKMASSAKIASVIVLFRGRTKEFIWESCSPEDAAIPCAGIIMSEIKDFSARIARADAGWHKSLFPSLHDMHRQLLNIYSHAFSKATCARLMIPEKADGNTLIDYLIDKCPLIKLAF
jgi:hypothetical protein